MFARYMFLYKDWAGTLSPTAKVEIWGLALLLFMVYIFIDNWDVLVNDQDPDD